MTTDTSAITDVLGIEAGHYTDPRRPTGCTVVIAREGAVAGVDVRGAAPGTRETDLLQPSNFVERVHAICLAGGSAWGLDAAGGVMRWLEEHGVGLPTGHGLVPIVPAAVLFDLPVGDSSIRPGADSGYRACAAASRAPLAEGGVGAGAGALVGKLFGLAHAMKGGIGTASVSVDGVTVGALVACNALGDVLDPATGRVVAGSRLDDGVTLRGIRDAILRGEPPRSLLPGTNTTLAVVATDALVTKPQAQRLAQVGHDGLARAINPVHTTSDGDTVFSLATGASGKTAGMLVLTTLAAEAVSRAVLRAVRAAHGVSANGHHWPAVRDLPANTHAS